MKFKYYLLGLVAFLSVFLTSCGSNDSALPVEETLAQEWVLDGDSTNVLKLSKEVVKTPSATNKPYLSIQTSVLYAYEWKKNTQVERGHWLVDSSSIRFMAYPANFASSVDSVAYSLNNNMIQLTYFHNHEVVGVLTEDGWKKEKLATDFTFEMPESNILLLNGADQNHVFGRELEVLDSGFNFMSVLRGLLGLLVLVAIAWLFSSNRKAVNWKVVGIGLAAQLLIALGILRVDFIASGFEAVSRFFVLILDFTREGSEFLLGGLLDTTTYGYIFMFQVLPTIIFFSALTSVLFYLGIIQKIVYGLAWVMTKFMKLSGAESLSVAGNIFLGQTESPLMIKAYLPKMNNSEILLVMIGGMATIAGGVLAAYVSFLGGDDPVARLMFAKHLLSASIMAAPGAVVIAKILVPPTEAVDSNIEITQDTIGSNILDAIANGTTEGLKLAANVGAMLLVFVAFIAMINYVLNDWLGSVTGLNTYIASITNGQYDGFSLQFILGYLLAPLMWLIGVDTPDIALVGQLLGEKVIMSEFIAYISLADIKASGAFASDKSLIMATYMLCGFANFASIGIQIGGIGTLAPSKRKILSKYGMKALLGGTLASLLSATMVGMIMG